MVSNIKPGIFPLDIQDGWQIKKIFLLLSRMKGNVCSSYFSNLASARIRTQNKRWWKRLKWGSMPRKASQR